MGENKDQNYLFIPSFIYSFNKRFFDGAVPDSKALTNW